MSIKITHSRPELIIFFFITSFSSLLFAITLFFKQQVDYSESSYFITSTSHMHLHLSVLQNQVYIYILQMVPIHITFHLFLLLP